MNAIRIAVVGSGAMGRNHIRALTELDGATLTAVVDPVVAPHSNELTSVRHYKNCDELIAARVADAVIVAAPTEHHLAIGRQLLQAGIPTLIEKPLASSAHDCALLAELARTSGVPLLVGHIERYNPVVSVAKQCIDGGMVGEVASISARRVGLAPPAKRNGNNVILDMAVHDLDIVTWLFGHYPETVVARTGRAVGHLGDDYADILMSFGRGSGFVQANWLTPVRIRTLTITGTEAYAELDYICQTLKVYRHRAFFGTASYDDLRVLAGQIQPVEIPVERGEPLKKELQNFINVVRGIESPVATAQLGTVAVILAELAMSSEGRTLAVEIPAELLSANPNQSTARSA